MITITFQKKMNTIMKEAIGSVARSPHPHAAARMDQAPVVDGDTATLHMHPPFNHCCFIYLLNHRASKKAQEETRVPPA